MVKHLPLALVGALAACYGPDAPFGAPCLQDTECPLGQTCNPETNRCEGPTELLAWRDDTAEDFAAAGSVTAGTAIERAGFVGPVAYFANGLRISGIDDNVIPDAATNWSELAGATRSGTSFVRTIALDYLGGAPVGLGLSGGNDITVVVEGELRLPEAGTWTFQLSANDRGFVELAPPGGSTFQRVATAGGGGDVGTYVADAPGWHRLRGAFADGGGDMSFQLQYREPGAMGQGFKAIDDDDLRAPAGDVEGYLVDGFDDPFLLVPLGSVVHTGTLAGQTFEADPLGLPLGTNIYSMRFAGQILIDVEGDYAFRIDSNDGHRVWIDGVEVVNDFGTTSTVSTTMPRTLEPGWHDFVVDLNRDGGGTGRLDVVVESGPAWVGEAIPLDHVRPVVGRGTRWAGGSWSGSPAIPDTATPVTRSFSIDIPDGMMTTRIEGAFEVTHAVQSSLDVKLRSPSGATTTLVAPNTLMGSGTYRADFIRPAGTAGADWAIIATDTVAEGTTGTLDFLAVTLTGRGGLAPFDTSYHYVSAPRDLGDVASFTHVRWGLRQADPSAPAVVSLRTCDSAEACADQPWTPVTEGARPEVPVRRFAQYMVQLTGDGDLPTALDWFELGYRGYTGD